MARALARVPAWAWLAGIVIVSTSLRYALGRGTPAPWIMVDELIYSELAKSFADTGRFLVRGEATAAYGVVYPALIAPAWALFESVPQAYAAAKAINALVMSLAAVPAYFLARRVLSAPFALAAAAFAVAVPSMVYTATLMTENAFYPLFVAAALVMVLWLERPTMLRTGIVLGITLVAYLTRQQALALLPALLTAPVLVAGRAAFRRYALLYGGAATGVLGILVVQLARGRSPLGLFGAYEVAGRADYSVGDVAKWFVYHLGELSLALGVLPFAALVLLALMPRQLSERDRIFVGTAVSLSFWIVLMVAVFASEQTFRISERNMFYVAPLFLIALLVWIERGLPRPQPAAAVAALLAVGLPLAIPYEDFIGLNAVSDTAALLPLGWLVEQGLALSAVDLVVLGGCVVTGLAFLLVPRRFALVLPAFVLVYFALSQNPIVDQHRFRSAQHLFGGITAEKRDWIDRAVGRDADVAFVWTGVTDKFAVWENELFNRSVGDIYTTGPAVPGGLAQTPVAVDRRTGYLRGPSGLLDAQHALADASLELDGDVVAEDKGKRMLLYRVDGPLRQVAFVNGLHPEDTWSRKHVTYTRYDCRGGTLDVELQSDPALFAESNTVVVHVRDRKPVRLPVHPLARIRVRIPLTSDGDRCVVRFTVGRTAVPAVVTNGANADPRELGMHFNRFRYRP
ncbi:MAG TPA: glycosyltransferase family 39 protein [Gaiellaceae bacterium]|nr:glycosyltransferase family 39 protein [Gaiellaceae bacterium]